jgi:hypothetical protein
VVPDVVPGWRYIAAGICRPYFGSDNAPYLQPFVKVAEGKSIHKYIGYATYGYENGCCGAGEDKSGLLLYGHGQAFLSM